MLSNFQVTVSVWFPARFTLEFCASVNTNPVVEQVAASAVHVATELNALLLNVPLEPVAFVHAAAFHVTLLAVHVVPPPAGGVNDAAWAWREI